MVHLIKTKRAALNTLAPRVSYIIVAPIWQAPYRSPSLRTGTVASAVVFDG
jgi:hypothetical protein